MARRTSSPFFLILLFVLLVLCFATEQGYCFGAGDIASFSYLEDKAFRHGDIENVLSELSKGAGAGFLAFKAKKFSPLDVKRVYFGNWLRDYSQAVDTAGLKKLPLQTIINICMALGFLAHGYATGPFEVTKDRLGCYLPTEHIDNPKGYPSDAKQYDPRLRGPVDPRELEFDSRSGMKNYIANEDGTWDTSKALVRRVFEACIHYGRQAKATGNEADEFEALRLLGQGMHTLEDFTAHSNWCELVLRDMGHHQVFPHVGRNVVVQAPNGSQVPILVTGTFGGSDFLHSLLGESTDHLSSASVSDLNAKVASARSDPAGNNTMLRQLLFDLPGGNGSELSREMDDVTAMRAGQPGGVDPSTMTPEQLHATLWKVLTFRDSVMLKIENVIDKIPGLNALIEKITNNINIFVFTTLEPYLKPLIGTATGALSTASAEVINEQDQYEVFNDPNASDPTHSLLSKDHFNLILNEPAGLVAKVIVEHTVAGIVKAWNEPNMDARGIIEDILSCMFHPAFHDRQSTVQRKMLERMRQWFEGEGHHKNEIINRLTQDSVRNHKNTRIGDTSQSTGHMHSTFGDGGLQGALASHNVHVPGAQVLNAGQDLLAGKMPWQQGFGTGGNQAWRGVDDNGGSPAPPSGDYYSSSHSSPAPTGHAASYYSGGSDSGPPSHYQNQHPHHQQHHHQHQQQGGYGQQGYGGGYQGENQGGYGGPPPPQQYQQQPYGGGGLDQYQQGPPQQGYGYGNAPPPPMGYGGPPPPPGPGGYNPGYQQQGPPPGGYY